MVSSASGNGPLVIVLNAETLLIAAGEDAGPRGDALGRGDIAAGEADAVAGHRVEVRRADVLVRTLDAEVGPAVVVRVDQDDVRLIRGMRRERSKEYGKEAAKHGMNEDQGEVEVTRSRRNSRAPACSPVGPPDSPPSPKVSFSSAMQGAAARMT